MKSQPTYKQMCRIFGNGDEGKGKALMQAIALRLEEARAKHPEYALTAQEAVDMVISGEIDELHDAVRFQSMERQLDECLDVIATCCRFMCQEFGGQER